MCDWNACQRTSLYISYLDPISVHWITLIRDEILYMFWSLLICLCMLWLIEYMCLQCRPHVTGPQIQSVQVFQHPNQLSGSVGADAVPHLVPRCSFFGGRTRSRWFPRYSYRRTLGWLTRSTIFPADSDSNQGEMPLSKNWTRFGGPNSEMGQHEEHRHRMELNDTAWWHAWSTFPRMDLGLGCVCLAHLALITQEFCLCCRCVVLFKRQSSHVVRKDEEYREKWNSGGLSSQGVAEHCAMLRPFTHPSRCRDWIPHLLNVTVGPRKSHKGIDSPWAHDIPWP